eukprot:3935050-Pyramimonas_sp.AAC.1
MDMYFGKRAYFHTASAFALLLTDIHLKKALGGLTIVPQLKTDSKKQNASERAFVKNLGRHPAPREHSARLSNSAHT